MAVKVDQMGKWRERMGGESKRSMLADLRVLPCQYYLRCSFDFEDDGLQFLELIRTLGVK